MYSLSALFLLAQASPVRYPLWLVIVAPTAAACVAALATLAATWLTLSRTNLGEQRRLDHEERMQEEKLKHESEEAWRVERRDAYSVFFSLARDVAALRKVPSGGSDVPSEEDNVPSGAPTSPEALRQAHATVELVGEEKELVTTANKLYEECKRILQGHGESRPKGYRDARRAFLKAARDELGLPPRPQGP
jgi:hypothetical protein